jgi:hypothetical protein
MRTKEQPMTKRRAQTPADEGSGQAAVWIDHDHAVISDRRPDGGERVEVLDRAPAETEATFEARTIDEIGDRERIVVSGPVFARTGFERAYTKVTHRPDRLVDVEPNRPEARRSRRPF